jgi:hypothetical protein
MVDSVQELNNSDAECRKTSVEMSPTKSISPNKVAWRAIHNKKSFSIFPSPAGMSLTKLSLVGNYDVIYKLFSPRESLVGDIPAGDKNIEKLFLRCNLTVLTEIASDCDLCLVLVAPALTGRL